MSNTVKTVALVEDDQIILKITREALLAAGFRVLEATNGKDGLDLILKEHPDLVLLDILLPAVSGINVLKLMREDTWGKDAKVIMFTNVSDNEDVRQAIENGAYIYLLKSAWKIDEVIAKVKEELK